MRNHNKMQAGGTFLGIIIGLIIGLAVAVVVAVAITKTPIPFTSKSNKQEKSAEPTPGQMADPNKALYGNKEPAKEAAKEFIKPPSENGQPVAEGQSPRPATKDETAPIVIDKSTPEKQKKSEPATADTKPATDGTAKSDAAEEKWAYFLQAGAFRDQTDAENARAKLALNGFEAKISEKQSENSTLYRVRIGPFSQLETMNRIRGKLSDNGVDVAVVRIPK